MNKWSGFAFLLVVIGGTAAYLSMHAPEPPAPAPAIASAPATPRVDPAGQARAAERIVMGRASMLDSYEALVREAGNGNAYAAYQLFQDASRCENLALREQALVEHAAVAGQAATDAAVARIAADRRFCEGVGEDHLARKNDWVVKAARLGHTEAQLLFFGAVTEHIRTPEDIVANAEELAGYKQEALRHLRAAAMKGSDTALFNMALAYNAGTLADRDPVRAYAQMLALRNRGSTRAADRYLEEWSRGMTAEQLRAAEALSRQFGR